MKGLPISEKMMLLRMGELIDGSLNNKTPTNPNPKQGRRRDRVTVTSGNKVSVGTRGALLQWNKVDNPNLLGYRVNITSLDGNALELNAIAYSNQFLFKGEAGSYQYTSSVLMRNGTSGLRSGAVQFTVSDSPMILEGDKFDVEDLGSYISQTVLCPLNYTAFVFASVVLDSFSDANDNPSVTLRLSAGETLGSSIFIEEFTLYPETEDLCNFDTGMGITRPSTATSRTGTFQTTQSVMFTPFQILEDSGIEDTEVKFWVTVTGHADDVVGLSCAIWVASEGLSEVDEVATDIQHNKCLELISAKRLCGAIDNTTGSNFLSNIWSFAVWMKPTAAALINPTDSAILDMGGIANSGFFSPNNEGRRLIHWITSGTDRIAIQQFSSDGAASVTATYNGGTNNATIWPLGANQWHFFVATFNGTRSGSKFNFYVNGVEITASTDNSASSSIASFDPLDNGQVCGIGCRALVWQASSFQNTFNGRYHQAGMWNVILSAAAVKSIYNSGIGAARNWINSFGNYGSNLDLKHYWRFGALDNIYTGPPFGPAIPGKPFWFHYAQETGAPGSTNANQADVDLNVANDVSWDLGNNEEADYFNPGVPLNRRITFSNRIYIIEPTLPSFPENAQSMELATFRMPPSLSSRPSSVQTTDDYPGQELGF
jgi:hypothetical protein